MTRPPVLLVPDFRGAGVLSGLLEEVAVAGPHHLLVVLNGPDDAELEKAQQVLGGTGIVSPTGLDPALSAGYAEALRRFPGSPVVRADTAEHPFGAVPDLLRLLSEGVDLVVGDLAFGPGTLRPGSADSYHNTGVLPALFEAFTGGAVALTGAHGYQALSPGFLATALPLVEDLLGKSQVRCGRPLRWAWDSAVVLTALRLDASVTVVPVPASQLRDRPQEKCEDQLGDLLPLLLEWSGSR